MGGAGPEPAARGGRRSLDAAVNLVPYVDILMTLMVFLVMCAVFTQMAVPTVQSATKGVAEGPADESDAIQGRRAPPLIAVPRPRRNHVAIAFRPGG